MGRWRIRLFWALILAVLTALGTRAYLTTLRQTVPVVVAAREIPPRTAITPEMLRTVAINRQDRDHLAPDAFPAPDQVVGRYTRRTIPAGEVLRDRPADLAPPDEIRPGNRPSEGALADFLPAGTRAVTFAADAQAVLGRHLRPGDRVDLIYTSKSDATGGIYASLILQMVPVLDVSISGDSAGEEALVTVLVTPQQAVDLALAKRTGVVDLALNPREPGDPLAVPPASPLKFTASEPADRAGEAGDGGE